MNLVLLRAGYPPVAIRPEDRNVYLKRLSTAEDRAPYERFMLERLEATLAGYLAALREAVL